MKHWKLRTMMALLLAAVLLVAAGCQAVGGVDLNKALQQSLRVTSGESAHTLELELTFAEDAADQMSAEEAEMLRLFSSIKLELDEVKQQANGNASMRGALALGDLEIGFRAVATDTLVMVELDGVARPLVLDLNAMLEESGELDDSTAALFDADAQAELTELTREAVYTAGDFLIGHLPNPERIAVGGVQEEIHGETLSLMKVSAELDGTEVLGWAKGYLEALLADRAGIETLLTELMALAESDAAQELLGSLGVETMLPADMDEAARAEQIAEGAEEMVSTLEMLLDELETFEADNGDSLAGWLNEQSYIAADLYIDSKLDVRKSDMELVLQPSEEALMWPLERIAVRSSAELWNVNGAVEVEALEAPADAIPLESLMWMESYDLMQEMEASSDLYRLFERLGLNRQELTLYAQYDYYPPIVTPDGVTIVPLRTVAEGLGGEVTYEAATGRYVVYDPATGTTIALAKNDDSVLVNGLARTWSYPVINLDGVLYVPARNMVEALGGTLHWVNDEELELRYLEIERVL
ncbi:copper amine oxidase N-terminal domain-containing protein [Paenibacillus sp. IB182496]|uniref:Copper amine oxidase N-terminal domain-containing protein n=1 Tax=Paenibacillus sabuli TaxID=2772509 RepID=A0A927BU41_9BACL|nr:copper amine oxidase N-terminal domain-containing protein [Paenibacillus sabuli]MBD2845695.1 copper amine oxidase N-terminal domain-containing protein [Paenibacillus sabuli]